MIRSRYLSALALATLLGAGGTAYAQATPPSGTPVSKPLCSSLDHPNAGKLAGKDTGKAGERSSSPVHMDCIPDGTTASANSAPSGTNSAATGLTRPTDNAATAATPGTSASSSANSAVTGSSTDVSSSITGSTSTFNPQIDLRGRSSLTIDNTTSTGNQSISTDTTTTTGNQAASSSSSATSGTTTKAPADEGKKKRSDK